MQIDKILEGKRRRLRTNPEKVLMDSSGLRLWADYLDVVPGFVGRIDFIHKINIPLLFKVECSEISFFEPADIIWKPSHISINFYKDGIEFEEQKFISLNDTAVSCMRWKNNGERKIELSLVLGTMTGEFETTYNKKIAVSFFCNGRKTQGESWSILPGEEISLCIAAQMCLKEEIERMAENCVYIRKWYSNAREAIIKQKIEYQEWFDKVPEFICDDKLINKTWAYRWYIFRHNMMNPGIGNLKETYFCEGRSHKMTKEPYHPDGWEFTKLIPLSVPMHLLDLRWYQEKEFGTSILHVMRDNQDENGEFRCAKVNWRGNSYANFFGWAVWQYYLISGDKAYAKEALPAVKRQIEAWKKVYGNEKDTLMIQYVHQLTGMEYQPSYWYFHDYPDNSKDETTYTPVKRVDRSVYQYLNTLAASYLCEICGDDEKEGYKKQAEQIRKDILGKMWDSRTGYFYDLHFQTDEKAMVKNIVGVFPYFAGITEQWHEDCLKTLFSEEFDTPCPFPSVSTKCPVFTAEGGWKGQFFKGRNGCIWNGPTWPFSNSIILDGMGKESQKRKHVYDEAFQKYFRAFTRMHYYGGDGVVPYLVEHYNSMTGECISDDVDYSHSYYIDLVMKYVAGISAFPGGFWVDPVDIGLRYFHLTGVHIQGHEIEIHFERAKKNIEVIVDGRKVVKKREEEKIEIFF